MGEGLYLWSRTSPGHGWRLVALKGCAVGLWINRLWFKKGGEAL
jgi:hypothetical protein